MAIAKTPIERSFTFTFEERDGDSGNDGLTLEGHAAVFNEKTTINSWEGSFEESIRPGAFKKSIRERTPVLQFDHGRHPLVGSIPLGRIESLEEDSVGLAVRARLTDNWLIQPVRDAIANQSVNGMSFRFEVIRDSWRDNKGKNLSPAELEKLLWNPGNRGPLQRELVELRVPELGPVVFPAYTGTEVSVRDIQTAHAILSDPELLMEARRQLMTGENDPELDGIEAVNSIARALLFGVDADFLARSKFLSSLRGEARMLSESTATEEPVEDHSDEAERQDASDESPPVESVIISKSDLAARNARQTYVLVNQVGWISNA